MRGVEPRSHQRERRRSLVVAACVAALVIMAGVQYLSTHGPDDVVRTLPQKPPTPVAIPPPQVPQARAYKVSLGPPIAVANTVSGVHCPIGRAGE